MASQIDDLQAQSSHEISLRHCISRTGLEYRRRKVPRIVIDYVTVSDIKRHNTGTWTVKTFFLLLFSRKTTCFHNCLKYQKTHTVDGLKQNEVLLCK
jgi:hypothetical protein